MGTEVATYVPAPFRGLETHLLAHAGDIAQVVGALVPADQRQAYAERLARVALHAMVKDPRNAGKLARCTPESVLLSVMNAAQLDLDPTGILGEGALIPYKETCTFQPMYRGLLKLARRAGGVKKVEAVEVWDCDDFHQERGTDPHIRHIPGPSEKRKELVAAYAVAWFGDGVTQFEVVTPDDIARIKKSARGSSNADSPWNTHENMMWRKSAVNRLMNMLELGPQERRALAYSNLVDAGQVVSVGEVDHSVPMVDAMVQAETEVKAAGLQARLEEAAADPDAQKIKATKRSIGKLLCDAGLQVESVADFAQTLFSGDAGRLDQSGAVQLDWLELADLESLEAMIAEAIAARAVGEEVSLLAHGTQDAYPMPAVKGT